MPCKPHNNRSPQDEQIHFGHAIIASTCKSFYFDRWLDISTSDRDTFQGSVPKPLVALVGAVVRYVFTLPGLSDPEYKPLVLECTG